MTLRFRRGTAAQATTANPVLAAGEPAYTTDARSLRVGDGVTPWADLPALVDEDGARTVAETVASSSVFHDFTDDADGDLTTLDSGQTWHLATGGGDDARLRVIGGRMTNIASASGSTKAGHAMPAAATEPINRIGATFDLTAGTTNGGTAALVLWSQTLIYPGPVVDSPVHVTFSKLGWDMTVFTGGTGTSLASGLFATPLATDGTLHRVEITVADSNNDGTPDTVLITLPDGTITSVATPALTSMARIVPSWETYQADASTDSKARFATIWADAAPAGPQRAPRQEAVVDLVRRAREAARPVAVQYPPLNDASGSLNVTVPATATEINAALRPTFVAPPSGKVLITLAGQLGQTVAGDIQWTVLILEDSKTFLRVASKNIKDDPIGVTILVEGLRPGSAYTPRWQHRATGSAAGFLRLNGASGHHAVMTVTPVR